MSLKLYAFSWKAGSSQDRGLFQTLYLLMWDAGARTQFVSTIATVALFQESGVPAILEDFPACRRRIPAGRPATIDRPVLSSVRSGEEVDWKSPPDWTIRFSCVDDPRYPDRVRSHVEEVSGRSADGHRGRTKARVQGIQEAPQADASRRRIGPEPRQQDVADWRHHTAAGPSGGGMG